MFERNKAFWTLFSVLTLLLMIVVYILANLEEERVEHEYRSALWIGDSGHMYFRGNPIGNDDLVREISKFHEETGANHVLHILVDPEAPYRTVAQVITAVHEAGHSNVAVAVRGREIYMDHSPDPFESEIPVVPVDCSAEPHQLNNSNPTSEGDQARTTIPLVEAKDPASSGVVVTLNQEPMSLKQLSVELKGLLAHREMSVVYVKAPHNMAFLHVMEILKAVKQSGVRDIGLQIRCP